MKYQSVQNWVDYISYLEDEELFNVKVDWKNQDKTKIITIVKNHYDLLVIVSGQYQPVRRLSPEVIEIWWVPSNLSLGGSPGQDRAGLPVIACV